jgi:transcriptional regulator with XRE-family HTH domain
MTPRRARRQTVKRSVSPEHAEVAQALRLFRAWLGLTQAAMAARCGLTQSLLSKYESGSQVIPAAILLRMARTFHLSLDTLLQSDTSWDQALDSELALTLRQLRALPPPERRRLQQQIAARARAARAASRRGPPP